MPTHSPQPMPFVDLMDVLNQAIHNLAMAEMNQYKLTPREGEIWLLRRLGHSYKEISGTLYISVNTVRKHLKNIYAKRKQFLDIDG